MAVKLTAKWQLDAALLSRPVDLTSLVSMSKSNPDNFLDDNTLHRLVTLLLNEKNSKKSDKVRTYNRNPKTLDYRLVVIVGYQIRCVKYFSQCSCSE